MYSYLQLMGPIMAICLGTSLFVRHIFGNSDQRFHNLVVSGCVNELIGLGITFATGVVLGILFLPFTGPAYPNFPSPYPTAEQTGRGTWTAILFGILIAAPSGAGVALAITSTNINSLVGVAISASLLPPAVNSGMLLVHGLFGPLVHGAASVDRAQIVLMAVISLVLTIVNIVMIVIFGTSFFLIRGVEPLVSRMLISLGSQSDAIKSWFTSCSFYSCFDTAIA